MVNLAAPPSLTNLPTEVQLMVIENRNLDPRDRRNIRLTCRTLALVAARRMFRTIVLDFSKTPLGDNVFGHQFDNNNIQWGTIYLTMMGLNAVGQRRFTMVDWLIRYARLREGWRNAAMTPYQRVRHFIDNWNTPMYYDITNWCTRLIIKIDSVMNRTFPSFVNSQAFEDLVQRLQNSLSPSRLQNVEIHINIMAAHDSYLCRLLSTAGRLATRYNLRLHVAFYGNWHIYTILNPPRRPNLQALNYCNNLTTLESTDYISNNWANQMRAALERNRDTLVSLHVGAGPIHPSNMDHVLGRANFVMGNQFVDFSVYDRRLAPTTRANAARFGPNCTTFLDHRNRRQNLP